MSIEEVAYFDGMIPSMNQFSICYWEYLDYFALEFQNVAAYCYTNGHDTVIHCLALWSKRDINTLGSKVLLEIKHNYIAGAAKKFDGPCFIPSIVSFKVAQ